MGAKTLEEITAWRLADEFKRTVYRILVNSPAARTDIRFLDQLRTSAASVPMNIAEGFCRFSGRDFARHLSIALGSLGEASQWLRDGIERGHFAEPDCEPAFALAKRCRAATLKFRSALLASMEARKSDEPKKRGGIGR